MSNIKRIQAFIELRKKGLSVTDAGQKAEIEKVISSVASGICIIAGLLLLLALHSWMVGRDMEDAEKKISAQARELDGAKRALAAVMNGGVLVDRADGTAYFFEKSAQKGL